MKILEYKKWLKKRSTERKNILDKEINNKEGETLKSIVYRNEKGRGKV